MDAGGLKPSAWKRIERLSLAWEHVARDVAAEGELPNSTEPEFITNPGRRARTPLAELEVDTIRTTQGHGTSVHAITQQFGAHPATVWEKTRNRIG